VLCAQDTCSTVLLSYWQVSGRFPHVFPSFFLFVRFPFPKYLQISSSTFRMVSPLAILRTGLRLLAAFNLSFFSLLRVLSFIEGLCVFALFIHFCYVFLLGFDFYFFHLLQPIHIASNVQQCRESIYVVKLQAGVEDPFGGLI